MQIKFCGANHEVTGSCHVLEGEGFRIALDAGFFQGKKSESETKNEHSPAHPATLDAIILSHAHIDHCGRLPLFVKHGFGGKIYCTPATRDLTEYILMDMAHIQESHARNWNHYHKPKNHIHPLYTAHDVEETMQRFVTVPLHERFYVWNGVSATFYCSGHILGSAQTLLEVENKKILYTGDVGRHGMPIIHHPEVVPSAEIVITESTYGDKTHETHADAVERFLRVIKETTARGGKVLIPAFAIERAQELVYLLHEAFSAGKLSKVPIYVDSPLAEKATEVFHKYIDLYDGHARAEFLEKSEDPFGFKNLKYLETTEESLALSQSDEACVIISSSGMCEAGRILHHLQHNIGDDKSTLVIVGFMGEGTLGRALAEGERFVKIYGQEVEAKIQVEIFDNFSAHADHVELLTHLRQTTDIQKIFLVHGEEEASERFAIELGPELGVETYVPRYGESVEI